MKYNTIGSSNVSGEGKKSSFTIYANLDISKNKMYTEAEVASIRGELEIVQKALKLQTRRCRQLVTEYTRRLQEKEQQYQSEKSLRDDQLAKVLKALLIFEARLKQEQKFITHQLSEKDYIIKNQSNNIKKLLESQYCKNCKQYINQSQAALETLDSSSEYAATDYQSSTMESLESSSETYATVSEKNYIMSDNELDKTDSSKGFYIKNKNNSLGRRSRKLPHRKSIGTYFEVLKIRNDSPISNEDNTSADYDNLDSLPPESISDKISVVSENIETILNAKLMNSVPSDTSTVHTLSECNNTVILKMLGDENLSTQDPSISSTVGNQTSDVTEGETSPKSKITDSIPTFDIDNCESTDWYASASDQEYEEQSNVYRNNPVLECMNQILLQNMNDSLNSPPKTPTIERKPLKNKRVKFSDEEISIENKLTAENIKENQQDSHNYYETPVQKTANFYETPQSIYSNDYEQILSRCSESSQNETNIIPQQKVNHYYVEMDCNNDEKEEAFIRKNKILRKPPALPPKPPNLVSKYKIQSALTKKCMTKNNNKEVEPDYCSISELNLPQNQHAYFKTINVVAEVHAPSSHDVINNKHTDKSTEKANKTSVKSEPVVNEIVPQLVVKKSIDKLNIQLAKQTPVKDTITHSPQKKIDQEIPKLPQVSEIIIPDDESEDKEKEDRITQDNYVKNNSQIFKSKPSVEPRKPLMLGSSVSSLISGFNNHQILNDLKKRDKDKKMFSSFECLQNIEKHFSLPLPENSPTPLENFDLSQNFEEFKLDDCEIEEYDVEEELNDNEPIDVISIKEDKPVTNSNSSTRVELIRATSTDSVIPQLNASSIELLRKQLQKQEQHIEPISMDKKSRLSLSEPTYEHFLECTGLSSKSILTPSRLLSNHKGMLKPKDVKLRSKVKAGNGLACDRHSGPAVKYWSEPYV